MSTRKHQPLASKTLFAFLEGEVTGSEAASIEAQLADSHFERQQLDRRRQLLAGLVACDPTLEQTDLTASLSQKLEQLTQVKVEAPKRYFWAWAAACAALLLAVGVPVMLKVVHSPRKTGGGDEFRAKSASKSPAKSDRWVGIKAFHVGTKGDAQPLLGKLPVDHGMLFAYTNLGPRPFDYLMIFAVDTTGRVFWFYPAYSEKQTRPKAVKIEPGATDYELPDLIHHDFSAGPLAVYGLFLRQPLDVLQIERIVEKKVKEGHFDIYSPIHWPIPKAAQHRLTIRVVK